MSVLKDPGFHAMPQWHSVIILDLSEQRSPDIIPLIPTFFMLKSFVILRQSVDALIAQSSQIVLKKLFLNKSRLLSSFVQIILQFKFLCKYLLTT